MRLQEIQNKLDEAVTDMPDGLDASSQIDTLVKKLEACKRALKIASGLPNPAEKEKYIKRIIGFMYEIRLALNKVIRAVESGQH
jgi:hypothetical protein